MSSMTAFMHGCLFEMSNYRLSERYAHVEGEPPLCLSSMTALAKGERGQRVESSPGSFRTPAIA
jgi:hypothetical protein